VLVDAQKVPLDVLVPPGTAALFPLFGQLSGNLALDLAKQSAAGQVAIANPAFGGYRADQFDGRISFANGVANLTGAELRRGDTVFSNRWYRHPPGG
jgi:hypothetical protein